MEFIRHAKPVWVPLVLVIIAATAVFAATGDADLAGLVANLGTVLALLLIGLYVVIFDPRNKWPHRNKRGRASGLMTFGRSDPPPASVHSLDEARRR